MSLLRLHFSLFEPPPWCRWALVNDDRAAVTGEGALGDVPQHAARVQLVLPAAEVLFARVRLPPAARHDAGSALAFAVEERTAGEPEANQVHWLGQSDGEDVLAVFDREGFGQWRAALEAAGARDCEITCETLLLPREPGEWSLAWNGSEGHLRTGDFEGEATDCGDRETPPLALRIRLEQARADGSAPAAITIHPTVAEALPDLAIWERTLQTTLRVAAPGDWRTASPEAGINFRPQTRRWRLPAGLVDRLRPAGAVLAAALALHAVALVADWAVLASERRALLRHMESSFRTVFPDAVAVADPALQMRRRLADARHAAGRADAGDFLAMIGPFADAARDLPPGSLRVLAHDGTRLTAELGGLDAERLRRLSMRLQQSGLTAESVPAPTPAGVGVLTVQAP